MHSPVSPAAPEPGAAPLSPLFSGPLSSSSSALFLLLLLLRSSFPVPHFPPLICQLRGRERQFPSPDEPCIRPSIYIVTEIRAFIQKNHIPCAGFFSYRIFIFIFFCISVKCLSSVLFFYNKKDTIAVKVLPGCIFFFK